MGLPGSVWSRAKAKARARDWSSVGEGVSSSRASRPSGAARRGGYRASRRPVVMVMGLFQRS
jgi:hypothetical protein